MTSFVDDVHSALKPVLWLRIRTDLAYWIRIRIGNADPDPDPEAWKFTKMNKFYLGSCFSKRLLFVTS
jgi:hypothetical protein